LGLGVGDADRLPLERILLVGPSGGAEVSASTALRFLGGTGGLSRTVVGSLGLDPVDFRTVAVLILLGSTGAVLVEVAVPVRSASTGAVLRFVAVPTALEGI